MQTKIFPNKLNRSDNANLVMALAVVLALFVGIVFVSYINTRTLSRDAALVTHTHEVLSSLGETLSSMKDAETGQRGFLLTGDEKYLSPFLNAKKRVEDLLANIQQETKDNQTQQSRLPSLRSRVDAKFSELDETIDLRRTKGLEAALAVVVTNRGKEAMDSIRAQIEGMQQTEVVLRADRMAEMENAYTVAVASGVVAGLLGIALSAIVFYLIRRSLLSRQRQEWLRSGHIGLNEELIKDHRLERLGSGVLRYLAEYLGATVGAFFIRDDSTFRRIATYGVSVNGAPESFGRNDGLLGQAVTDKRPFLMSDIPEGYLTVGTSFGSGKPRHLLVVPTLEEGEVNAVLELGFFEPVDNSVMEIFKTISETLGTAVQAANFKFRLQSSLEETQRQSEELQAQGEELRVSNEELEEQSRALRESQVRLELQQAELEQTNAQLEEQTQILETQKEDLVKSQEALELQARRVEQASQYKSDFLANMSHELRTPLNSTLILAKLLGENSDGNLSAEQVEFADTIYAAGNDLLSLINDILDLSKIESGHMEMASDPVSLVQIIEDMRRSFEVLAKQKGIALKITTAPGCVDEFQSDKQRFEQILRNLLSNAIKFTEVGEVVLEVTSNENDIAFAVRDTGIGIAPAQQKMVFEAFRQADGTTNRKYGGTGLGLSIARELARLLGGEILLESEPDKGSTFTVILPRHYNPSATTRTQARIHDLASLPQVPTTPKESPALIKKKAASFVTDDRKILTGDSRVILVVEDDTSFAKILMDVAHELRFHCLVAASAEEGLALAVQYRPSAVVLDVGLPDSSGLSVLDRLKQDSRTRHIPVHVVSAHDYSKTALSLGAVGHMLKPVKRQDLVAALQQLEGRLEQRLRKILIVEDDAVQLKSMQKLLELHSVATVGAASVTACLEELKKSTFDCMVLDLSLPDASGYTLLETLSREDNYAFPPVIVYTGHELSPDEEQRLRRYSKSIIIKGARSPERLLDEVTLFLHQVVTDLPPEQQRMIESARRRDAVLEGKRVLIAEDDVRNVFALTSILEPRGANVLIARNGREALNILEKSRSDPSQSVDLVLMDIMMPEMDGITAIQELRKRQEWKTLPVIALTAKAMKDDQEQCLAAGANDYMAKPLDVEKLLSLVRVWIRR